MIQKEYVHASFCTGIGACELAAMWMGWRNAFSCEIDPFCHQVLKYYYPYIKHYENIFGTDFSEWRGKIDILTAGFPCQPFSCAGSRKGAEDDRYLWPEVLRGVDEIRPNWFIGENVAGITSMVLPGDEIKVESYTDLEGESYLETEMRQQFIVDRICNDLESIGYSVQPIIIPACAVGAPHRRDRIWFIAHGGETIANCSNARPEGMQQGENGIYEFEVTANPNKFDDNLSGFFTSQLSQQKASEIFKNIPDWENFPSQSPVRFRYDGISNNVVRYIKTEVYDAIKEYIRREDLPRVWEAFQKKKVREQIGGLFEIPEPNLLLEVLQRTSENRRYEQEQNGLSQFSEETSGRVLCYLRKYGTFASSPFGQKYKEQFAQQFGNIMPELSYEIALATKKIVEECERTASWVRAESIKAYGNSMVPQLVYQIFKAIGEVENLLKLNQNKKNMKCIRCNNLFDSSIPEINAECYGGYKTYACPLCGKLYVFTRIVKVDAVPDENICELEDNWGSPIVKDSEYKK